MCAILALKLKSVYIIYSCIRNVHLKTDTIPQMFVKVSLICPHIPLK